MLEIFYPKWLANVFMVKKSNEKWQMFVDFTDLNHACSKDSFPLPRIDNSWIPQPVMNCWPSWMCFQAIIEFAWTRKIRRKRHSSLIRGCTTTKSCHLAWKMQWLPTRGWWIKQIWCNMEIYVNDILVKSKRAESHLDDLRETLDTLRKYQIRLNSAKCVSKVSSGKFMGFMVS